jgi:hypothetical protein
MHFFLIGFGFKYMSVGGGFDGDISPWRFSKVDGCVALTRFFHSYFKRKLFVLSFQIQTKSPTTAPHRVPPHSMSLTAPPTVTPRPMSSSKPPPTLIYLKPLENNIISV